MIEDPDRGGAWTRAILGEYSANAPAHVHTIQQSFPAISHMQSPVVHVPCIPPVCGEEMYCTCVFMLACVDIIIMYVV